MDKVYILIWKNRRRSLRLLRSLTVETVWDSEELKFKVRQTSEDSSRGWLPCERGSESGSFRKREDKLGEGLLEWDNLEKADCNQDGIGDSEGLPGIEANEEVRDLFGVDDDDDVFERAGEKNFLISPPTWGFFLEQLITCVFLL